MKILVVGATGYVGSHAARHLAAAGHDVVGTYRSPAGREKVEALGARAAHADLDRPGSLDDLLIEADATLYAAQLLLEPEHQAAAQILGRLEGTDKTFLFTSGTGVLSQKTDGRWSEDTFTEDEPFVPSKWLVRRTETEALVREAESREVRAMVVRPPMIWGNGQCGLIRAFYRSARQTGDVCYIGPGLNLYSNVHVEDLAELYRRALESGSAGALYHCVGGEVAHRTLAEAVARQLGCATRSIDFAEAERIWGKFFALIIMSTCSRSRSPRARRELGWAPTRLDMVSEAAHLAWLKG
jgi:nucleoside-diphosphate-sugar epimerase